MKAAFKLELFGDNIRQQFQLYSKKIDEASFPGVGREVLGTYPQLCWVAEIVGYHPKFKFDRRFLSGKKDYTHANGVGSRGVYLWYVLESGKVYEVQDQTSWKAVERYFVAVDPRGKIQKMDREEVESCLRFHSGSTS